MGDGLGRCHPSPGRKASCLIPGRQRRREDPCRLTPSGSRLPRMSGIWTRQRPAFLGRCPSPARMVPMALEEQCQESACCQIAPHLGRHSLAKLFLDCTSKLLHKIPRKGVGKAGNRTEMFGSSPRCCWSDYCWKTKNLSLERMTMGLPAAHGHVSYLHGQVHLATGSHGVVGSGFTACRHVDGLPCPLVGTDCLPDSDPQRFLGSWKSLADGARHKKGSFTQSTHCSLCSPWWGLCS